jgi:hypothetical protein
MEQKIRAPFILTILVPSMPHRFIEPYILNKAKLPTAINNTAYFISSRFYLLGL